MTEHKHAIGQRREGSEAADGRREMELERRESAG